MFRVDVDTLEAYFAFDPKREADLRRLDALIMQWSVLTQPTLSAKERFRALPARSTGSSFKGRFGSTATQTFFKPATSPLGGKWLIEAVR
jgi:hypothetical protein